MRSGRVGMISWRVITKLLGPEIDGSASTASESSQSKEKTHAGEECGCVQIEIPSKGSAE